MHGFRGADNGVYWARLDTQRTADTQVFINRHQHLWFDVAKLGIQGSFSGAQESGQSAYGYLTTRWALVDFRFACCDGLCVSLTTGVSTLSTLGLGKPAVNLFEFQSLKFKV